MVNYQVMLNSKAFSKDLLMVYVCSLNELVLLHYFQTAPCSFNDGWDEILRQEFYLH